MRKIVLALMLVVLLVSGCSLLERYGITPERLDTAADATTAVGKRIPGTPGAAVELVGWLIGIVGVSWGGWKRSQGKQYKRALEATAEGIERAKLELPEGAIDELIAALKGAQTEAHVRATVNEVRNGG